MEVHLNKAIEQLGNMLAQVASKAEGAVLGAVSAAAHASVKSARDIIAGDRAIDEAEVAIEEECLKILALHQPVASDLRRVITVLKVNGEIERVGDLAVNIAERVEDIAAHQAQADRPLDFAVMVDKACLMLRHALDALAYGDAALAETVIASDEEVDQLHRDMYGQVRQAMLDCPELASYYLNGLTISRCLERIADIATNIAEDVVYMESGRIVRHLHEGEKHVH
ncbi:MAG: phosphate signaling complex protein PhoU [Oligosphaeraceae bacterium]